MADPLAGNGVLDRLPETLTNHGSYRPERASPRYGTRTDHITVDVACLPLFRSVNTTMGGWEMDCEVQKFGEAAAIALVDGWTIDGCAAREAGAPFNPQR